MYWRRAAQSANANESHCENDSHSGMCAKKNPHWGEGKKTDPEKSS